MSDIILSSAHKLQIQSTEIINKAYETHSLITNLMPQVPQEGQRCISFIALDVACIAHLQTEIPRQNFANTAVVPQIVYQRYLEAFLDALETRGQIYISLKYILKCMSLLKYLFVAEKILKHICTGKVEIKGILRRSDLAIAAFLTAVCFNRPCDFNNVCIIAGCVGNKTINGYLKATRAKSKELLKELKKEANASCAIQAAQFQDSKPNNLFISISSHLYNGSGEGIMSFCGLNAVGLV